VQKYEITTGRGISPGILTNANQSKRLPIGSISRVILHQNPRFMSETPRFSELLALTRGWCSRRERCSNEVIQRLKRAGADDNLALKILDQLIEEGYVDDDRYAEAFVSGHFKIKGWGRYKIRQALRMHALPNATIEDAIRKEIQPDEYFEVLTRLLIRKGASKELHPAGRQKIIRYALGRGFESELILSAYDHICND
jgi:regulatory protein